MSVPVKVKLCMGPSTENEKHRLSWAIAHVKMQSNNCRLLCLK